MWLIYKLFHFFSMIDRKKLIGVIQTWNPDTVSYYNLNGVEKWHSVWDQELDFVKMVGHSQGVGVFCLFVPFVSFLFECMVKVHRFIVYKFWLISEYCQKCSFSIYFFWIFGIIIFFVFPKLAICCTGKELW